MPVTEQKEFGDHGETLHNNQQLSSNSAGQMMVSKNKRFRLVAQHDGNVVLYQDKTNPLWASNTNGQGQPPYRLHMQPDNHLVMYDVTNRAIWGTGVYNKGASNGFAHMQDDGNFVVYDGANKPMWCTRTNGPQKSPHPGKGEKLM